jgi:hypothetical protein
MGPKGSLGALFLGVRARINIFLFLKVKMSGVHASSESARAFITNIKETPMYVAFFHGEFDTCPTQPLPAATVDPPNRPTLTVPQNVSLMQLTQPGEFLLLSSSVLFYLIHKKQFYTNVLMPMWAVEDPIYLQSDHPDAYSLFWNLEERGGHTYDEIISAGKKLVTAEAVDALTIMKEATTKRKFTPGDRTHFEKVLRFMGGDQVSNLKLTRYDSSMVGLGLYKFLPSTGKITRIEINQIHTPGPFGRIEDSLRLYHLINYVQRVGGGRIMLFSCASLASPILRRDTALASRATIQTQQQRYIARNPVMNPETNWDLFIESFPTVFLPNLLFVNSTTLKAVKYNILTWALLNLLVTGEYYKGVEAPKNLEGEWRIQKITKKTAYGRQPQNVGQSLSPNENKPEPGEGYGSYMCRRTKQGCVMMGGTRRIKHRRRRTRKY